jgi:manganese-dependent inorganic pyrophosphatase
MPMIVTAYENPDVDGTACAYAYAEFLNKQGTEALAVVFGVPHREAQFVMKEFKIEGFAKGEEHLAEKVVLVDASDLRGLSDKLAPNQVIEIIDHRKIHEAEKFPNAKSQIELVGSAATLIAEKFKAASIEPSEEAAALLFSAIVSNTINFQAKVTTDRDQEMAEWLQSFVEIPDDYVHRMFADKSAFTKNLKETMEDDYAMFDFGKQVGIAQLEIVDVDNFIDKNKEEIQEALKTLKKEKEMKLCFLTTIDLEKGFNVFVTIDDETEQILSQVLNISFDERKAKREGIIMRKEIIPLLKAHITGQA